MEQETKQSEPNIPQEPTNIIKRFNSLPVWVSILIVVLVIAVIGGGIVYAVYQYINDLDVEDNGLKSIEKTVEIDEFADWKTYRNEEYGFEMKHPSDWSVEYTPKYYNEILEKYCGESSTFKSPNENYALIFHFSGSGTGTCRTGIGGGEFIQTDPTNIENVQVDVENLVWDDKVKEVWFKSFKIQNFTGSAEFSYFGQDYKSLDMSSARELQIAKKILSTFEFIESEIDKWIEINHGNFWGHEDLFASSDYYFPNIKFSHPLDWDFSCCNDMDHGSSHLIFSSDDYDRTMPYIEIVSYILTGCPDANAECGLDQVVKKTPSERNKDLIAEIKKVDGVIIKSEVRLQNLNVNAFVYEIINRENNNVRSYLVSIDSAVFQFSFVNYDKLKEDFVGVFLDKIYYDD